MALQIGINGFGRIGRCILRAGWDDPSVTFVHVNDLTSPEMLAHLLQHDSVHGKWDHQVEAGEHEGSPALFIDGKPLPISAETDPKNLPWGARGADVILECTGVFRSKAACQAHLDAGAKKVIISAPGKGVDGTFVMGVNDEGLDPVNHTVISNGSCTTNCLAPVLKVIAETAGVQWGEMTTVHSYTMDQTLLDAPHRKGDMRRARAAAMNIVPTSTGAATAVGLVLPELDGKMQGLAIRVPTPDGSLVDLTLQTERDTTTEALLDAFKAAEATTMAGILEVSSAPLVSSDIVGNPHSSILDSELLRVTDGRTVKLFTWYDNEWGFSNRMLDMAKALGANL